MNPTLPNTFFTQTASLELNSKVRDVLNQVLGTQEIDDSLDLFESGTLDSLALVSLIMELETSFDLVISYDDLEIENFKNIQTISNFVLANQNS